MQEQYMEDTSSASGSPLAVFMYPKIQDGYQSDDSYPTLFLI